MIESLRKLKIKIYMFDTISNNYPRLTIFTVLIVEILKESPLKLEEKKVIVITVML